MPPHTNTQGFSSEAFCHAGAIDDLQVLSARASPELKNILTGEIDKLQQQKERVHELAEKAGMQMEAIGMGAGEKKK